MKRLPTVLPTSTTYKIFISVPIFLEFELYFHWFHYIQLAFAITFCVDMGTFELSGIESIFKIFMQFFSPYHLPRLTKA